jgi:hypothetical protein
MTDLRVIFLITITTMVVIKIKQIALIVIITKQVSRAIPTATATAIVMQVAEVAASIAVVVLQAAHVLQEFHKPPLRTKKFIEKF